MAYQRTSSIALQKVINENVGGIIEVNQLLKSDEFKDKVSTLRSCFYNLKMHTKYVRKRGPGKYKILQEVLDLDHITYSPKKLKRKLNGSRSEAKKVSQSPTPASQKKHKSMIEGKDPIISHYESGKLLIEDSFSRTFEPYSGVDGVDAICIPGPHIERHLQSLIMNVCKDKGKIFLVDRDPVVCQRFRDVCENRVGFKLSDSIKDRTAFFQGNIMDFGCDGAAYQDIDLMATWPTFLPIIKKRLFNQIMHTKSNRASIIGTVHETLRGKKVNLDYINDLLSLFKSPIKSWSVERDIPVMGYRHYLKSYEKHLINKDSKAVDSIIALNAFRYKDGAKPMFTFQLIYKPHIARTIIEYIK